MRKETRENGAGVRSNLRVSQEGDVQRLGCGNGERWSGSVKFLWRALKLDSDNVFLVFCGVHLTA